MARGSIEEKGRLLLVEGRLAVKYVELTTDSPSSAAPIIAQCRGDSGEVYHLGYDGRKRQWRCTCMAKGKCSHLVALQLVTTVPER